MKKVLICLLACCLLFSGCKSKKQQILDQNLGGASNENVDATGDIVDLSAKEYSYETFCKDADKLAEKFDGIVKRTVLGKSEFNRDLIVLSLGNTGAKKKILIVGGVYGKENITSLIAMKQLETYCTNASDTYRGTSYSKIMDECCFYFVPMLNPDGVEISVNGIMSVPEEHVSEVEEMYAYSESKGILEKETGYKNWCANGLGVDLSMNFGIGKVYSSAVEDRPAAAGYPQYELSASESSLITVLCTSVDFDSIMVYNETGRIVEWQFGQSANSIQTSLDIANELSILTGFSRVDVGGPTKNNFVTMSLMNWFITKYDRPAFNIRLMNGDDSAKDIWGHVSTAPMLLAYQLLNPTAVPQSTDNGNTGNSGNSDGNNQSGGNTTDTPATNVPGTTAPTATAPGAQPPQVDYDYID